MKKALDYVSDYQLKSACKDATCIAPSKVTQMIFAVLEDWYHHIVLTHRYKLLSFLHIYLLFYCQKPGNEPDACKKCYGKIRIFTFYLFKAAQYTSGRVQKVGCVYYYCWSYCAGAHYTWKSGLTVVDFNWRPSNWQTFNPHLRQMLGSWWYLL